jgi:hypothetical protein
VFIRVAAFPFKQIFDLSIFCFSMVHDFFYIIFFLLWLFTVCWRIEKWPVRSPLLLLWTALQKKSKFLNFAGITFNTNLSYLIPTAYGLMQNSDHNTVKKYQWHVVTPNYKIFKSDTNRVKNCSTFQTCEMNLIKTILNFPAKYRKTISTDIALPIPIITVYNNYCY